MIQTICCALLATLASAGGNDLKVSFENLSGDGLSVLFNGNFKLNGQNYSPWNGQEVRSYLNYPQNSLWSQRNVSYILAELFKTPFFFGGS